MDQVSHVTTDMAHKVMKQRREVPVEVEWPGSAGDAMRALIGKEAPMKMTLVRIDPTVSEPS